MTSYKIIYLIYIILCLKEYTDSGLTSEEQDLCLKNLREDFDYPEGSITNDIMTLPRKAFKDIVFNKFKTVHGVKYYFKMIEKAATSLTMSPKKFCENYDYTIPLPSYDVQNLPTNILMTAVCVEKLRIVFQFTDEGHTNQSKKVCNFPLYDTLSVIKWTYVHITESIIPKQFKIAYYDNFVYVNHFAFEYFHHMLYHLDLYVSFPKPVVFCRREEPYDNSRPQNYKNISDENPGESSKGEETIKERRRAAAHRRLKEKSKSKKLFLDD